jgi:hypothetical protein
VPNNSTRSQLANGEAKTFTNVDAYINPGEFETNKNLLRKDLCLRIENNEIDAGTLAEIFASSQDAAVKALVEEIYNEIQNGDPKISNDSEASVHGHKVLGTLLVALSKLYEMQTPPTGARQIVDTENNRKDLVSMPLTFDWLTDTFPFLKEIRASNQSAYVEEIANTGKPNLGLSGAEAERRKINISYASGGRLEYEMSLETLGEDIPNFKGVFAANNDVTVPENTAPLEYATRPEGTTDEPVQVPGSNYRYEAVNIYDKKLQLGLPPRLEDNSYLWGPDITPAMISAWLASVANVLEQEWALPDFSEMRLDKIFPTINVQPSNSAVDADYLGDDADLSAKRAVVYLRYIARLAMQKLGVTEATINMLIPLIPSIVPQGDYKDEENANHFYWNEEAFATLINGYNPVNTTQEHYLLLLKNIVGELKIWTFTKEQGKTVIPHKNGDSQLIGETIYTVGDYQLAIENIKGHIGNEKPTTIQIVDDRLRQTIRYNDARIEVMAEYSSYNLEKLSSDAGKLRLRNDNSGIFDVVNPQNEREVWGTLTKMTWNGVEVRHVPYVGINGKTVGARTVFAQVNTTIVTKTNELRNDGEVSLPVTIYPTWPLTFTETTLIYQHLPKSDGKIDPAGIVGLVKAGKIKEARAAYDRLAKEVYSHILAQLGFEKSPQAFRAIARVTDQLYALDELIKAHDTNAIEDAYIAQRKGEISDLREKVSKYDLNSGSLSARQANLQQYLLELEEQQALHAAEIRKHGAQSGVKYSLKMPLLKQTDGVYTGEERDEDGDRDIDIIARFDISTARTTGMINADTALDDEIARVRQLLCGYGAAADAQNYLRDAFSVATAEELSVLHGLAQKLKAERVAQDAAARNDETYQPQITEETKKFWLSLLLAQLSAADTPENWLTPADRALVENLAKELNVTQAVTDVVVSAGADSVAHVFAVQENVETAKALLRDGLVQEVANDIKDYYVLNGRSPEYQTIESWVTERLNGSGLRGALQTVVADNKKLQEAYPQPDVETANALGIILAEKARLVFENTNVMPAKIECYPGNQDEMLDLATAALEALLGSDTDTAQQNNKALGGLIAYNAELARVLGGMVVEFGKQLNADSEELDVVKYLDLMKATDPEAERKLYGASEGIDLKTRSQDWGEIDRAYHSIVPPDGTDPRITAMHNNFEPLQKALSELSSVDPERLRTDQEYYDEIRRQYQKAYDLLRGAENELPSYATPVEGVPSDKGVFGHLTDEDLRPARTEPAELLREVQTGRAAEDGVNRPLQIAIFPLLDEVLEEKRVARNTAIVAEHDRRLAKWLTENPDTITNDPKIIEADVQKKHQAAADIMTEIFAEKVAEWQTERDEKSTDFTEYRNERELTPYPLYFGGKMPELPETEDKEEETEKKDDQVFPNGGLQDRHIAWKLSANADKYNLDNYKYSSNDPVDHEDHGLSKMLNFGHTLNPNSSKQIKDTASPKLAEFWATVDKVKEDTSRNMQEQGYTDEEITNTLTLIQHTAERLLPKKVGQSFFDNTVVQLNGVFNDEKSGVSASFANKYDILGLRYENFLSQNDVAENTDFTGGYNVHADMVGYPPFLSWQFDDRSYFRVGVKTGFDHVHKEYLIHEWVFIVRRLKIEDGQVVRAGETPILKEEEIDKILDNIEGLSDDDKQKYKNQLRSENKQSYPGAPHQIIAAIRKAGASEADVAAVLAGFPKKGSNPPAETNWVTISKEDAEFYETNNLFYKIILNDLTFGEPDDPPVYLGTGLSESEAKESIEDHINAKLGRPVGSELTTEEKAKAQEYLEESESGAKLGNIKESSAGNKFTGVDKAAVVALIKAAIIAFCNKNTITQLYDPDTQEMLTLDAGAQKYADAYYTEMETQGKLEQSGAAVLFKPGTQSLSATETSLAGDTATNNAKTRAIAALKSRIAQAVADFAATNNITGYKNSDGTPTTQAESLAENIYNDPQLATTITETHTLTVAVGSGTTTALGSDVAAARNNIITALKSVITTYCTNNGITNVAGYTSPAAAAQDLAEYYFDTILTAAQKTLIMSNWSVDFDPDSTDLTGSEYGSFADAEAALKSSLKAVLKSFCDSQNPQIPTSGAGSVDLDALVDDHYNNNKSTGSVDVDLFPASGDSAYQASGTIDAGRVTAMIYNLSSDTNGTLSESVPTGQPATAANLAATKNLLLGRIDTEAAKVKTTASDSSDTFTSMKDDWKQDSNINTISTNYFDDTTEITKIITCSGGGSMSAIFPSSVVPANCRVDCVLKTKAGATYTMSELETLQLAIVTRDSNNSIVNIQIGLNLGEGDYTLEYTLVSTAGETIYNADFINQPFKIRTGFNGIEAVVGVEGTLESPTTPPPPTSKKPYRITGYKVANYKVERKVSINSPKVKGIDSSSLSGTAAGATYSVPAPDLTSALQSAVAAVSNFGLEVVSSSVSVPGFDENGITTDIVYNVPELPISFTEEYQAPEQTVELQEYRWYEPVVEETKQPVDVEKGSDKTSLWFGIVPEFKLDMTESVKVRDKNGGLVTIRRGWILEAAAELLAGWISLKETYRVVNEDNAEEMLALLRKQKPGKFDDVNEQQWDLAYKLAFSMLYQFSEDNYLGVEMQVDRQLTNDPHTGHDFEGFYKPQDIAFTLSGGWKPNGFLSFNPKFTYALNFADRGVSQGMQLELPFSFRLTENLTFTPAYEQHFDNLGSKDWMTRGTLRAGISWRFLENWTLQVGLHGYGQHNNSSNQSFRLGGGVDAGIFWRMRF